MEDLGFWVIAGGTALVLLAVFLRALGRPVAVAPAENPDIAVYRDQLAEVERDLARGTLAADEAQRLRTEVARRLLEADR
ncbi:MAG: c-type cytochrome biogenesis protein CcmI, partial [Rhodobacteraceae bacterium]|nr:c-type cytochrome biogenesis protein CcmI [Paracoccaceae bacterium]